MGDYQTHIRGWITAALSEKAVTGSIFHMIHGAANQAIDSITMCNVGMAVLALKFLLKVSSRCAKQAFLST